VLNLPQQAGSFCTQIEPASQSLHKTGHFPQTIHKHLFLLKKIPHCRLCNEKKKRIKPALIHLPIPVQLRGHHPMRTDVLSLAAIVFVVGVLISGLGVTNVLHKKAALPAELQQGFALSQSE
jgi:hypothetical protein